MVRRGGEGVDALRAGQVCPVLPGPPALPICQARANSINYRYLLILSPSCSAPHLYQLIHGDRNQRHPKSGLCFSHGVIYYEIWYLSALSLPGGAAVPQGRDMQTALHTRPSFSVNPNKRFLSPSQPSQLMRTSCFRVKLPARTCWTTSTNTST